MPVTLSLCKGILGTGLLLAQCGIWLTKLAAGVGMLIVWPYMFFGLHLFQSFGNQQAVRQWFSEIVRGMYTLTDILAMWPLYHQEILDGLKMSWLLMGFIGVLMIGALPLGLLVTALLPQCQCQESHKAQT